MTRGSPAAGQQSTPCDHALAPPAASPSVPAVGDRSARSSSRGSSARSRPATRSRSACASGDPDERSAVLWTRLTTPDGSASAATRSPVTWELADDETFASIVATGDVVASGRRGAQRPRRRRRAPARRSSASAPATGRARSGGSRPTGDRSGAAPPRRRRAASTSRPGSTPPIATSPSGHPTSSSSSATSSTSTAGRTSAATVVRSHDSGETFTHRRVPRALRPVPRRPRPAGGAGGVPVAGDLGRPRGREQLRRGRRPRTPPPADEFAARRLAAYQAWWEHMPVRIPRPGDADDTIIYRTVRWGVARRPDAARRPPVPLRPGLRRRRAVRRPGVPGDRRTGADDARRRAGAVARRSARRDDGDVAGDRPADRAQRRHAAQRCRAQLRPVGRLPGGPPAPAAAGGPGASGPSC